MVSLTTSAAEGWRKSSHSAFNGSCLEWRFRKSSHSNRTECLEAAFRKSSHSTYNGDCTEAALAADGVVLVRDSKQAPPPGHEGPAGPVLEFTVAEWAEFTDGIKAE